MRGSLYSVPRARERRDTVSRRGPQLPRFQFCRRMPGIGHPRNIQAKKSLKNEKKWGAREEKKSDLSALR